MMQPVHFPPSFPVLTCGALKSEAGFLGQLRKAVLTRQKECSLGARGEGLADPDSRGTSMLSSDTTAAHTHLSSLSLQC